MRKRKLSSKFKEILFKGAGKGLKKMLSVTGSVIQVIDFIRQAGKAVGHAGTSIILEAARDFYYTVKICEDGKWKDNKPTKGSRITVNNFVRKKGILIPSEIHGGQAFAPLLRTRLCKPETPKNSRIN